MGLLNVFKKKDIPEELPELILDKIETEKVKPVEIVQPKEEIIQKEEVITDIKPAQTESAQVKASEPSQEIKPSNPPEINSSQAILEKNEKIGEKPKEKATQKNKSELILAEKSYYKDLEKDLKEEINDIDKISDWYKNKFLPRDIVSEMRMHWEKKKNGTVLKILGRDLHERVESKTVRLQELEREWQEIYFDLIEKEEEIREEERQLKKTLSEFVELCKRKNKDTEVDKKKQEYPKD